MKDKYNVYLKVDDRGIERSLRKFKRLCESFGIVKEYRSRKEYKKPSIRKKEKTEAAQKKRAKLKGRSGGKTKI
ncbi:MAG: 30S ribosomal protein S21 [Bacteriovoracaceae bacterium]|nr:30S ribosomal protein S21 [Bacteriovoracaceae bacterium]